MILCLGCMEEIEENIDVCPHCGYVKDTPVQEAYYLIPGTILHRRYIVGRVLGYGGFGVTYIGWDAQLNRKLAIKEYLPSDFSTRSYGETRLTVFSGDAYEQFRAGLKSFVEEAQRLAKFQNTAGIVSIYDSFIENDTGYIIMECLEGETVKEILKQRTKMYYEEAVSIVTAVLEGLEVVHKEGIIHRDIAPDNIYITNSGQVKLLDFGAARYATSLHSRSLSVILKPGYAPEEQYRSHGEQGPWTDMYALGATFYKMITGITPIESVERMVQDELKPPSKLGVELPVSLENTIMNSLNVRKEDRIQTAREYLDALARDDVARNKVVIRNRNLKKVPKWMYGLAGLLGITIVVTGTLWGTGVIGHSNVVEDQTETLQEGQMSAPDLRGSLLEDCESEYPTLTIQEDGEPMSSDIIPKNQIISQDVAPLSIIEEDSTIEVKTSLGKENFLLPDYTGQAVDDVKEAIIEAAKEKDITLEDVQIDDDTKVKSEEPLLQVLKVEVSECDLKGEYGPKTEVEKDSVVYHDAKIYLTISMGDGKDKVFKVDKDFTGKKFSDAKKYFDKKSIQYTKKEKYDNKVAKGKIIRQEGKAGEYRSSSNPVVLYVSKGAKTVPVPQLVGYSKEKAVKLLKNKHLGVTITEQYDSRTKGLVISQGKAENARVKPGTKIAIVVSKGPAPATTTPSVSPYSGKSTGGSSGGSLGAGPSKSPSGGSGGSSGGSSGGNSGRSTGGSSGGGSSSNSPVIVNGGNPKIH